MRGMAMVTNFTDWNGSNNLEHYGIPGMKWGVRRYMNKDGSLTDAGKKRYGPTGTGGSPKRMTKDFNDLDKSYANFEARRRSNADVAARYARRMNKAREKGDEGKASRMSEKAVKYGLKAGQYNKNKAAVENLQWQIIAKAARKGWTVNSEPVQRVASDGKTKVITALTGPLGGLIYSSVKKGRNATEVSGQNITVSRRGNRKQAVINYAAYRNADVQAQIRKNRVEQLAKEANQFRR